MDNENIDICGLIERIDSVGDFDVFKIKDFVVSKIHEEEKLVEVLTGENSNEFFPIIDRIEESKDICAYRVLYYDDPEYFNLSINQLLAKLSEDLLDCYIICEFKDDKLAKVYSTFDDYKQIIEKINDKDSQVVSTDYNVGNVGAKTHDDINIKEISNNVKNAIINQDEVVDKTLANIAYNQRLYYSNIPTEKARLLKKNMLIFGKTGTGKTEIIKQILENIDYEIPYVIEDANNYTIDGYKGRDVIEMLRSLVIESGFDVEEAEHGILVIDEIDKKLPHGDSSGIASTGVQKALLKIIEGGEFDLSSDNIHAFDQMVIDTSLISVILLGHFDGIYKDNRRNVIGFENNVIEKKKDYNPEDFIKLGMIPEFMGRINSIIKTNDMDMDVIKNIISSSKISPLALEKEFYDELGVKLSFDEDFITNLAKKAIDKGTGARGIKSSYDEMMGDLNFEVLSGNIKEVAFEKGKIRKLGIDESNK